MTWVLSGDHIENEHDSGAPNWTNPSAPPPYRSRSSSPVVIKSRTFSGCFSSLAICTIAFISFFLAVIGAALIIIGCFLRFSKSAIFFSTARLKSNMSTSEDPLIRLVGEVTSNYINDVIIILIAFGVILLAISLAVIFCTNNRSACPFRFYIFIIVMIALIISTLAIILYIKGDSVKTTGLVLLTDKFNDLYGNNSMFTITFDAFMQIFKCCGVNNGSDFAHLKNTRWKTSFNQVVPYSCCFHEQRSNACTEKPTLMNGYKDAGCFKKLWYLIKRYRYIIISLAFAFLSFSVFILFLCFLMKSKTIRR